MRAVVILGAIGCLVLTQSSCLERGAEEESQLVEVFVVGNNWDGTADVFDAKSFRHLKKVDIVPDFEERRRQILDSSDVNSKQVFGLIRQLLAEGNDQLVDDMFTSPDGHYLYASRPSFRDVVAIDLQTGELLNAALRMQ